MQTAPGASLRVGDRRESRPGRTRRRCLLLFTVVAALGYTTDLVTKMLAVDALAHRAPVHVVGDVVTLELVRNPGAAFSTGTSYTFLLSGVAIVAAGAVLWFARRLGSTGWALGLGFLLAGVLGNLTDRVFRAPGFLEGHVVDFIRLPHWPVFNMADVCINIAAALIIIQALRGMGVNGRRHQRAEDGEADS